MSSHASRVWITSARPSAVGQRDLGRRRRPAGRRGRVVVVVVEPALARRPRTSCAGRAASPGRRAPCRASWGWTPAVAQTVVRGPRPRSSGRRRVGHVGAHVDDPGHPGRRGDRRAAAHAAVGGQVVRGGSGRRSSARRPISPISAREERARPSRPGARRGSRPRPRPPGRRWSSGRPVEAERRQIAAHGVGHCRRGQHRDDAQRLEGVAEHGVDLRPRARPSTARWPRGRRWSPGPAARWPRGRRDGWTRAQRRGGRRVRLGGHGRQRAVGARRRADAVALLAHDRGHPGRGGCRSCWPGRRCSGRPWPRS